MLRVAVKALMIKAGAFVASTGPVGIAAIAGTAASGMYAYAITSYTITNFSNISYYGNRYGKTSSIPNMAVAGPMHNLQKRPSEKALEEYYIAEIGKAMGAGDWRRIYELENEWDYKFKELFGFSRGGRASNSIDSGGVLSGDSEYLHRIDPNNPGRPHPYWSIDSMDFVDPVDRNANNWPQDNAEFWRLWLEKRPETISSRNRFLIEEKGIVPEVDAVWIRYFPEHERYINLKRDEKKLVHHHVDHGRYTIPVPAGGHKGSGGPWHGKQ